MITGKRAARVGEEILKEVASLLAEKMEDPRLKGVTMTGIRLSNNLRQAKVFFSVIGDREQIARAQAGLDSARHYIRKEIGQIMSLRYLPELTFIHDNSLEQGSHMDALFDKIRKAEERNDQ
ncbi:MAG: 30S ribosome-binding factor RbfA [Deltaproteobacteria bacterium]|nr:30S ribosome-binding factor RbfA [Deltaproteobacteria bacterium]